MEYDKLILFIFTYVFFPLVLTIVQIKKSKKGNDRGSFDISFSIFTIYLIGCTIYNFFTSKGLWYVVGLSVAVSTKDAILGFYKGLKKLHDYQKKRLF